MKRVMMTALAGALGMAMSVPAGAGGILKAPDPDWTGGQVTCRILHTVLEENLGYKVKRITMPTGVAVDEGLISGDLDVHCERWPGYDPLKEKYVSEYGGDGSIVYYAPTGIVGASGYYVPRYMVEGEGAQAPDLKTYKDLNQYKELFATLESEGKGRLLGCPVAAWECEDKARLETLGVDYVVTELGSETAHFAEMQAAYKRKEPFLAYAWEPHWIFAVMDLVEVQLPEYSDAAWPATDWPQDVTQFIGSPKLAEKHPEIIKVLEKMRITNDEQAQMILRIEQGGEDIDEVVAEWFDKNEDRWKSWVATN